MKAFCIGLALLLIIAQFKKGGMKVCGFLGFAMFGCASWGLGSLVLLIAGK